MLATRQSKDMVPSTSILDINEALNSEEKTKARLASPENNTIEVMSKEMDHGMIDEIGKKHMSRNDGDGVDHTPRQLAQNLEENTSDHVFCKKARVSIRARLDAPLVGSFTLISNFFFFFFFLNFFYCLGEFISFLY